MTNLGRGLSLAITVGMIVVGAWAADARWNQGRAVAQVVAAIEALQKSSEYNLAVGKIERTQDEIHTAKCRRITEKNEDRCHELQQRLQRHERTIRQLEGEK